MQALLLLSQNNGLAVLPSAGQHGVLLTPRSSKECGTLWGTAGTLPVMQGTAGSLTLMHGAAGSLTLMQGTAGSLSLMQGTTGSLTNVRHCRVTD